MNHFFHLIHGILGLIITIYTVNLITNNKVNSYQTAVLCIGLLIMWGIHLLIHGYLNIRFY